VRELQRLLIKSARTPTTDDEVLFDLVAPGADAELSVMKEVYRAGLVEAVRATIATAPARDRTLLRYHVVDGLSIDEIGKLYGVNRSTAWRWLVAAREAILVRTREELTRRLAIAPDEVDSVIRLARSRLDMSFESLLTP
jgi:RNA polymerase sigma-70 factor (ECF subfamily)